ncbi:MAG: OmpA family protein [Leeuwenhoekiella sp.]
MNQKYISLLLICLVTQAIWSQNSLLKKAEREFAARDYHSAIRDYTNLEKQDRTSQLHLADSYYFLGKTNEAATIYEELFRTDTSLEESTLLRYVNAEKANGNYEKANEILSKYYGRPIDIINTISENKENLPLVFELQTVDKESDYSAFGPAILGDQILFSSDRNIDRPIYDRTQQPFLDFYTATLEGNSLTDVTLFSENINTPLHEGNATISSDGKTMFFTRTNENYKRINGVKVAVLKLFKSNYINGEWQTAEELPFTSDSYSTAHPALSSDDKRLYFTSDMPGGFGLGDIYYVELNSDNSFGNPVKLGATVNSEQEEQFPYIAENGELYFASDRLMGMGALDVYRSDYEDGKFKEAYNLGNTINSSRDDFSLVFNKKNESGFLSSNRDQKDMIYSFTAIDNRKYTLTGSVTDSETKNGLKDTKIDLFVGENSVKQSKTDNSGNFELKLAPNKNYRITAIKNGYETTTREVATTGKGALKMQIGLVLQPLQNVLENQKLDNIYFDFDKAIIRQEASKTLDELANFMRKNNTIKIMIGSHTDAVGSSSYNNKLSIKRAEATKLYLEKKGIAASRIMTKGYGEDQLLISSSAKKANREERNRRSEFKILKDQ